MKYGLYLTVQSMTYKRRGEVLSKKDLTKCNIDSVKQDLDGAKQDLELFSKKLLKNDLVKYNLERTMLSML